jgi:uncharacterized OB-fold protein
VTGGRGRTRLEGSVCRGCATVAFPPAQTCRRCGGRETTVTELGTQGTLWAHTVQRFPPKSPPYVPPADGFRPFAVGYVELPEGIKIEAILDCDDVDELVAGAPMSLVATEPVPRFAPVRTEEER